MAVEKLVARIRLMAFQNILRQPIGWFDIDKNAPGRLITGLARDAPMIKHVSILLNLNKYIKIICRIFYKQRT